MAETGRAVSAAERGAVDLTEAVLLHDRIGETFDAVILDEGQIAIESPPVRARCTGAKAIGERVQVRLTEADPLKRSVRFEVVAA